MTVLRFQLDGHSRKPGDYAAVHFNIFHDGQYLDELKQRENGQSKLK